MVKINIMYILNRLPQLQMLFISAFFSVFLFSNPDITEKQKELLEQLPPDQRNSVMDKMANINNLQEEVDEKFENPNTLVERPDPYTAENTCEECIDGFTGENCAEKTCPGGSTPCSGRGTCSNGVCHCDPSFVGLDCGTRILTCPGNCLNRGSCEKGVCSCSKGFENGPLMMCEYKTCPGDCNEGTCDKSSGLCTCNPSWTSSDCSKQICEDIACSGHGNCVKTNSGKTCECDENYGGASCSKRLCNGDDTCANGGKCIEGQCLCASPFYDDHCETRACIHGCNSNGVCREGVCECSEGFTGPSCGTKTCPDCGKFGKCNLTSLECVCEKGYVFWVYHVRPREYHTHTHITQVHGRHVSGQGPR